MKFASRLLGVDESATFKYSNLARERKVINLTIGRTNFSTPAAITEATKKALNEGKIHYTPTKGIPELRKAIAEKLGKENDISDLSADNVLVSVGAKQIIYEAVMAIVERGDVVAISDPSWVSYESIVKLAEGKVSWLPLSAENGFIPDEKYFSALENAKPKLILLNSPNNPTGAVYPEKVIRKIVDIAERKDSILLSDEIYERIIYEGERFSAGSIYENTITVNGFSKEYSMTGWRLGYAASKNKELIDKMDLIQAQTVSCAVSFIQYGALGAYTESVKKEVSAMIKELKERRDYLVRRLEKTSAVLRKPAGAFYLFPYFSGEDDIKLADKLMDAGVGVIPGSPFGSVGRGCVRMSYGGVGMDELKSAADILEEAL
jgi:aspartate aminotransferase